MRERGNSTRLSHALVGPPQRYLDRIANHVCPFRNLDRIWHWIDFDQFYRRRIFTLGIDRDRCHFCHSINKPRALVSYLVESTIYPYQPADYTDFGDI